MVLFYDYEFSKMGIQENKHFKYLFEKHPFSSSVPKTSYHKAIQKRGLLVFLHKMKTLLLMAVFVYRYFK